MKPLPLLLLPLFGFGLAAQDRERAPRPGRESDGPMRPTYNPAPSDSRPAPGRIDPSGGMRGTPARTNDSAKAPAPPATLPAPTPRSPGPVRTRHPETTGWAPFPTRDRCTVLPTQDYWLHHDLMAVIRAQARSGFVPVMPFPDDATEFSHYALFSSGWRAYGFLVPPGGTLRVDLQHAKPAWFRTYWCDKWGEYRPGMKAKIGDPSALYENLETTVQAVYLIVDDPGNWSNEKDPYLLKVQRSWDPKLVKTDGASLAAGIWNPHNTFTASFR